MAFNVVCAIIVGLFGSPVRIYIFSNVGYIVAVAASLYGYFIMRQFQPERVSPFRLPYWFRWVALACALFLTFDYFVGGWNSPDIVVGPGPATSSTSWASSSWPPTSRCTSGGSRATSATALRPPTRCRWSSGRRAASTWTTCPGHVVARGSARPVGHEAETEL